MKHRTLLLAAGSATAVTAAAVALALAGCAATSANGPASQAEIAAAAQAALKASFSAKGQAGLDRVDQDDIQKACSGPTPPAPDVAARLASEQAQTVKYPADGHWLGDWKAGEKLAQDGKGKTWNDPADKPAGGNCYNCHQITKSEISFGTIGPSLYHYGKLRGVSDPNAPEAKPMLEYTWAKLWNAKATNACSNMPRFGHQALLDEGQIRDLMALLLDPKSPVNAD